MDDQTRIALKDTVITCMTGKAYTPYGFRLYIPMSFLNGKLTEPRSVHVFDPIFFRFIKELLKVNG